MMKTFAFAAGLLATLTKAIKLQDEDEDVPKVFVFEEADCTGKVLELEANTPFSVTDRISRAIDQLESAEIPVGMTLRVTYRLDGLRDMWKGDPYFEIDGDGECMDPLAWALEQGIEGFDDLTRIHVYKGIALAN